MTVIEAKGSVIIEYMNKGLESVGAGASAITNMGTRVNDTQQAMRNMVMAIDSIGNAVDSFANDSIQAFASFDQAMANTTSITSGTAEELEQLRGVAESIGRDFPVSAQAAADGMYQLASAGQSANDIMELTPQIMKASIASGADFATTAKLVTAVQDSWGKSNEDVNETTDILLNTVKSFKTTLPELAVSMQFAATQAAALGVSVPVTAAAIGQLRQAGLDASVSGTGLRMVMIKLAASSSATEGPMLLLKESLARNSDGTLDFTQTMVNLNDKLSDTGPIERQAILTQMFGARAASAATILTRESANLNDLSAKMTEAGSVQEAYNVQVEGGANQLELANAKYEAQQIILGEKLLPAQLAIIEAQTDALDLLNKLPGKTEDYAIAAGMVASKMTSALMPIMLLTTAMKGLKFELIKTAAAWVGKKIAMIADTVATGAATAAQWALDVAMDANPVGLIILAIAALVAILLILIIKYKDMSDIAKYFTLTLIAAFGPIGAIIALIMVLVHHMDIVKDVIYAIGDALIEVGDQFKSLGGHIMDFFNFLQDANEAGEAFAENLVNGIKDGIEDKLPAVAEAAEKIAKFFGGSPPEKGPLRRAMDFGPKGFVDEYSRGLMNETASFSRTFDQRTFNISPTFNNDFRGGANGELVSRSMVEQITRIMQEEVAR